MLKLSLLSSTTKKEQNWSDFPLREYQLKSPKLEQEYFLLEIFYLFDYMQKAL